MKEAMTVHIGEGLKCLVDDIADLIFAHWSAVGFVLADELVDILMHVFKYKVELVVVFDQFMEVDDIGVVKF